MGINKEVKNRYGRKVIRGGVDTTGRIISGNTEYKFTEFRKRLIAAMSTPCDVRYGAWNRDPAIRSSDIVPRHVSLFPRDARVTADPRRRILREFGGFRCGLVLIGSTSWIVDDGLDPVMRVVSSTLSLHRSFKLFSAPV